MDPLAPRRTIAKVDLFVDDESEEGHLAKKRKWLSFGAVPTYVLLSDVTNQRRFLKALYTRPCLKFA